MRSILLRTPRMSSRALLLPRLPCSSFVPRRHSSTTSSPAPIIAESSSQDISPPPRPSLVESTPSASSSQPPSTRLPPPPLHVRSFSPSTVSPQSTSTSTAPSRNPSFNPYYLTQAQIDNHQAKAVALAARLEAEGSEGLVGTPEFFDQVRPLFKKVPNFARASGDHLQALSTVYHRFSTSTAVVEVEGRREWTRKTTIHLLFLFTRRPGRKFESLLPYLRLVLHSGSDELDLTLTRDFFRKLAVGLASGAKDASEAVEIVGELKRLSPSSFAEVEYEELLQAIGRVEDWTSTTRESFQLPSFPSPVDPLPPPPRPASPPTPPSRPSTSIKPVQPLSSPSSSSPPNKGQVPPSPSPSSLSNNAQQQLLQFSLALSEAPPPSVEDLQYLQKLFDSAFPRPHNVLNRARIEVAVHILRYASQTPPLPPSDRSRFATLVSFFVDSLKKQPFVDFDSFGPDVRKDLLSLVGRAVKRAQLNFFARFVYQNQKEDFQKEELKAILDVMERLPVDDRQLKPLRTYDDWEKGFRTRLGEMMEDASSPLSRSSPDTFNHDTDADWIDRSRQGLQQKPILLRGQTYQLLESRSVQAPSSSESLVVASRLYLRFVPPDRDLPDAWRTHGDAIVRMLLLFSNHQGETPPPFKLLGPVLCHLPLLPPSFIPSTPSFPSFAIPLLPMATNLNESLLIVNSILHAQELDPIALPKIWSTFLSSVERHSTSPSAERILGSQLFKLVQARTSSEENRTGPTPLEDVVQMYLRRVENKGEGAKGEELKELEKLEKRLIQRGEGKEAKEKVLGELRRVLKEEKVGERV